MKFLLGIICVFSVSELAICEPEQGVSLDRQSSILADITRLQDIADGNWNHSIDPTHLDSRVFGTKRMPNAEVKFLLERANLFLERKNGFCLFLRLYKYQDVKLLWNRLKSESIRAGTFDKPFKMILSNPLDGSPKYKIETSRKVYDDSRKRASE